MGRPIEATFPLDIDTIKLLIWVSEYGSGHPNISRLYDNEVDNGLELGRNTFFGAIKGRNVTVDTARKIDEMIAVNGWMPKWVEHLQEEHRKRVVKAFESHFTRCEVCGASCPNCGTAKSEQRRKAVFGYLKMDPTDLGCKVRDQEEPQKEGQER